MKLNIINNHKLSPVYTCGRTAESIDIHFHGVNHAVWTILDNLDKHVGNSPKVACKICHDANDEPIVIHLQNTNNTNKLESTNLVEVIDTTTDKEN